MATLPMINNYKNYKWFSLITMYIQPYNQWAVFSNFWKGGGAVSGLSNTYVIYQHPKNYKISPNILPITSWGVSNSVTKVAYICDHPKNFPK